MCRRRSNTLWTVWTGKKGRHNILVFFFIWYLSLFIRDSRGEENRAVATVCLGVSNWNSTEHATFVKVQLNTTSCVSCGIFLPYPRRFTMFSRACVCVSSLSYLTISLRRRRRRSGKLLLLLLSFFMQTQALPVSCIRHVDEDRSRRRVLGPLIKRQL